MIASSIKWSFKLILDRIHSSLNPTENNWNLTRQNIVWFNKTQPLFIVSNPMSALSNSNMIITRVRFYYPIERILYNIKLGCLLVFYNERAINEIQLLLFFCLFVFFFFAFRIVNVSTVFFYPPYPGIWFAVLQLK